MNWSDYLGDLHRTWPEILLSMTALIALLTDLLLKGREQRVTGWITAVGVVFTLYTLCADFGTADGSHAFGLMVHDRFALFFKLLIASGLLVVTLLSIFFRGFQRDGVGEYYSILVTAAVGGFFLVSTDNLLLLFLALETLSIPSYVLSGFLKRDVRSSEAAIKYLVFGVLASGALLYGFSLLYGYAGSLSLPQIGATVRTLLKPGEHGLTSAGIGVAVAVLLALAGFGYKVAAFPFHFWSPDVYEGAPTPVTTFLSVVSKAASFGMIVRFFGSIVHGAEGSAVLSQVIALVAALSMTFGNVAAMLQDNAKRMLAYSSVAHSGYVLAGLAALTAGGASSGHGWMVPLFTGGQAIAFYLAGYVIMNLGAFAVVIYLSNRFGTESIGGWSGLGWKAPVASGALAIFLLSLTGIPPTIGFVGKWGLLQPILTSGMYWLAFVFVLNSVVSLFYYFRMIKSLLLHDEERAQPSPRAHAFAHELGTIVVLLAALTVFFGLAFPLLSGLVQSLSI